MAYETLVKEIEKYWDQRTTVGKNVKKIARWGIKHPQSAVPKMLRRWNSLIASMGEKKAQTLDIKFEERPEPAEKHCTLGNCLICGTPVRFATKISARINGRKLNFGEVGDLVGEECFEHIAYIAEAAGQPKFKMYETTPKERKKQDERLTKVTVALGELDKKAVKKLEKLGYNLESRILADVANEVQKQVMRGKTGTLDYHLDPGKTSDIIGWAVKNRETIYDADVRYTTALLSQRPDLVSDEQWAQFLLYQWQERPLKAEGELGGIKEDILHLAKLDDSHLTIQEYGKVNLSEKIEPVKAFNKARWKDATLGELLGAEVVTKAQSRAVKQSVPYLQERREQHNREAIKAYCNDPEEFNSILAGLEQVYRTEKTAFSANIDRKGLWTKDTYLKLRNFFTLVEDVQKTADTNARDVLISKIQMKKAKETIETLYLEGRKIQLAEKYGTKILGRRYTTLQEANVSREQLDVLTNAALELNKPPKWLQQRIQKTGMTAKTIGKIIEDIKTSAGHGILPWEYTQPEKDRYTSKELPSRLERTLSVIQGFEKNEELPKTINYLKELENTLGVKIANVRAADGRPATRKSDPRLNIDNYAGKTHFSPEQKKTLEHFMKFTLPSELRDLDIEQTRDVIESVKKFYEENKIYTTTSGWNYVQFSRAEVQKDKKYAVHHPPVKWHLEENEKIQNGRYAKISPELRKKLDLLRTPRARKLHSHTISLPQDIEEILNDPRTLISPELAKAIDSKYQNFTEHARQVRNNRRQLAGIDCDVDALTTRLIKLRKKHPQHKIPSQYGNHTDSLDAGIAYLRQDITLNKAYVKKINDATRPAEFVIKEGKNLYNNTQNNYFDFVMTCDLQDPRKNERRLKTAFGPKRNQGKALLKWTPEERDIGGTTTPPNTWYGTGRTREYFDQICARAEKMGNIYVKITHARQ